MTYAIIDASRIQPNLTSKERVISIAIGLALASAAVRPRPSPLLSLVALVGGSYLALRGASGRCAIKAALTEERIRLVEEKNDPIAG